MAEPLAEAYARAIESAFADIEAGKIGQTGRDALARDLCAAGLPFAAAAVIPRWDTTNPRAVKVLRALDLSAAAMPASDIATVGTALTFWVSPRVACIALPATSPLRAGLTYEDTGQSQTGKDAWLANNFRASADPLLLAEVDAARLAEGAQQPRARDPQPSSCFYPATDSAVGWIVHIAYRIELWSRRDVEPALVGHALRGDIDPEFALGVCLHLRIKERITGSQPADPMSEIAAILAEAIERRRRPALVLPAVII